ncbi:MAG: hypothetical protein HUJ56_03275 [Erysipelotrichaceae bacterium]|nr:hypothetical protein [Erysipelotrichaceae bacterium]
MTGTYEVDSQNTDIATTQTQKGSNLSRRIKLDMNMDGTPETEVSLIEKPIASRIGNPSNVRLEIRYGKDDTLF